MQYYRLFAGEHYYPHGGMDDYIDIFPSLKDAQDFAEKGKYDWVHIVEADSLKRIKNGYYELSKTIWEDAKEETC